jgi:hypothetical protein
MLVRIAPGPVTLIGQFLGKADPRISSFEIRASRLDCPNGELGARVHLSPRQLRWATGELAWLQPIPLHELGYACLGALSDIRFGFRAHADAPWLLKLGGGLSLDIRREALVELRGATRGDASQIRLCEPVEIRCADVTVQLGSGQFRALSRLAKVKLTGATLHPDGSVDLQGGSRRVLDRAIQGGLSRASRGISSFVRQNVRMRRFLSSAG